MFAQFVAYLVFNIVYKLQFVPVHLELLMRIKVYQNIITVLKFLDCTIFYKMLKNVHPATFQLISCRSVSDADIYCALLKDIKPLRKKNIKLKFIPLFNSNECTSQFVGAPYNLLICIESMLKISDRVLFSSTVR